ncbi:hypothetical protein HWV62_25128 [Athelia sp. TMB]|nr:hypothetical protein HWV62_25128 [Athelia sp. TMB]
MPPRRPTAGDVDKVLDMWPTLADLPESLRANAIHTNFNLEDVLKRVILSNPWVPPTGDRCPINDLPNELLAHIFHLGAFEDDDEEDEDDMYQDTMEDAIFDEKDISADDGFEDEDSDDDDDDGTPTTTLPFQVLVSHVCSHWRTVAVETPVLWSTIKFVDEPSPFTRCKEWLHRSKDLPIEVIIDCTREADTEASDSEMDVDAGKPEEPFYTHSDLHTILEIVTPHAARWRVFEVEVNEYSFMRIVTDALAALPAAPALQILQLHHYGEEADDEYEFFLPAELRDPAPVLFAGNAPKLEQLALWGVHLDWSAAANRFLAGLKDVELAYHAQDVRPTWAELAALLAGSPALDTLSLCLSGPRGAPSDWAAERAVPLPSLRSLVLAFHPPEDLCALVRLLPTPNLTSLSLDLEEGDYSAFAALLAAPEPGGASKKSLLSGLEHLKLSGLPCAPATVDVMYEQLGALRSINLKLFDEFLDARFFERLTQPIDPAAKTHPPAFYLPHLDTLTTSGVPGAEMRRLVEARKKAGVPVKRLFMCEDDDVSMQDEVWFRAQLETFELFEPSDDEEDLELVEGEMDMDEDNDMGLD